MPSETKLCSKCHTEKPINEFHKGRAAKGCSTWCKVCQKAYAASYYQRNGAKIKERMRDLYHESPERKAERIAYQKEYHRTHVRERRNVMFRHKFGDSFDMDEYERLLEKQKGVCAICGKNRNNGRQSILCVDHDHATGEVRGLLCQFCNRGLGFLGDDLEGLKKAIRYLKRFTK